MKKYMITAVGLGAVLGGLQCFAAAQSGLTIMLTNASHSKYLTVASAHILNKQGRRIDPNIDQAQPFNLEVPFNHLAVATMYTGDLSQNAQFIKMGISTTENLAIWCLSDKKPISDAKKSILSFSYPKDFTCWTQKKSDGIRKVTAP